MDRGFMNDVPIRHPLVSPLAPSIVMIDMIGVRSKNLPSLPQSSHPAPTPYSVCRAYFSAGGSSLPPQRGSIASLSSMPSFSIDCLSISPPTPFWEEYQVGEVLTKSYIYQVSTENQIKSVQPYPMTPLNSR